jgi:hypothetical protein
MQFQYCMQTPQNSLKANVVRSVLYLPHQTHALSLSLSLTHIHTHKGHKAVIHHIAKYYYQNYLNFLHELKPFDSKIILASIVFDMMNCI